MNTSLFGSNTRDSILKFLALAEQSYPSQISQTLQLPLFAVQRAVDSLQASGILSSRLVGGVRVVELNRVWFAKKELTNLLIKIAETDPKIRASVATIRKRPRRAGKEI